MQNCTISNQSIETIHVECVEGFDGGLPQMFLLELVEIPALKLVRNLTLFVSFQKLFLQDKIFMKYFIACRLQKPPVSFFIDNLEAGSSYRIILFSANAKGRSEPTIIDEITFKGVAKYTGNL